MDWKTFFSTFDLPELHFHSVFRNNGKIFSPHDFSAEQHFHDYRELLLVAGGQNDFILGNRKLHLVPGDVVLIDSMIPHSFEYTSTDRDLQHLWFFFKDNQLRMTLYSVLPHGRYAYLHFPYILPQHISTFFTSRWNEFNQLSEIKKDSAEFYLETPFKAIIEELRISSLRNKHDNVIGNSGLIESITHYIESQNARNCSLKNLEKIFGYNSCYIAHRFKKETGSTPGQYINRIRKSFTEDALARGLKQKEIAVQLGFSSPAAFWKWFKNNMQSD